MRSWWLAALVVLATGAAAAVRLGRGELGEATIAVLVGSQPDPDVVGEGGDGERAVALADRLAARGRLPGA